MAKSPNLKINVGADTSQFQKGMQTAKRGLKDFEKVSSGAIDALGDALGVNISGIQQYVSALGGAASKLSGLGTTGASVFGKLATAAKGLAGGIAGLGIAGAVMAFKQLTAEANNFKSLAIGDHLQVEADAFRATVKQAMMDVHTETGRAMAEWMTRVSNNWTIIATQIKGTFANLLSDGDFQTAWRRSMKDLRPAIQRGNEAGRLAVEIDNIQDKMSDLRRDWSSYEAQITNALRIATDSTEALADRQKAVADAKELINKRYYEEAIMLTAIAQRYDEMNALAGSTQADLDRANQAWEQANRATAALDQQLKSLNRIQRTITTQTAAEAKEREKALQALKKQGEEMAKLSQLSDLQVSEAVLPEGLENIDLKVDGSAIAESLKNAIAVSGKESSIAVKVKPEVDNSEWEDVIESLQGSIASSFAGLAEALGSGLVDMFSGDGLDGIFSGFLRAIGGFAKQFGAALMAFGFAKTALAKALESMSPASAGLAIAAGAALVAVGAALSSISSKMGGSGGYSSSNVASSSYGASGTGSDSYQRTMQVQVVGTLRANGSVLEAVLAGENNRKQHTT